MHARTLSRRRAEQDREPAEPVRGQPIRLYEQADPGGHDGRMEGVGPASPDQEVLAVVQELRDDAGPRTGVLADAAGGSQPARDFDDERVIFWLFFAILALPDFDDERMCSAVLCYSSAA